VALIEMIQKEFLAERKYEGLTEKSLRSYVDFFKVWNEWLNQEGIERVEQLNSKNTKAYLIWCIEVRSNQPKTINTKLKLLRSFANWLCQERITEEPFTTGVKMQRDDSSPKILAEKDLRDILRHLRRTHRRENSFQARRNVTLILFMAGTGTRLSEVCSLRWDDIDIEGSLIIIKTSKSRKAQSVPLSDSLRAELLDYKDYLQRKLGRVPVSVFVTLKGEPLKKDSIQNIFKRLRIKLGIETYFSPHTLRNYFLKSLLKNGTNLREVQLLARHSKVTTTTLYLGYWNEELKEALDESNPLRDLL
jgi:site-specific recombinase XerD